MDLMIYDGKNAQEKTHLKMHVPKKNATKTATKKKHMKPRKKTTCVNVCCIFFMHCLWNFSTLQIM